VTDSKTKSEMLPICSLVLQWLPRVTAAVAFPVVISHGYWAFVTDCDVHFSRGGSLLVFMAVLSIFGLEDRMHRTSHMNFCDASGPIPFKFLGPYIVAGSLAMIGTLIWGYGDLIANYFGISSEGCG
jgi:hypothetical protein